MSEVIVGGNERRVLFITDVKEICQVGYPALQLWQNSEHLRIFTRKDYHPYRLILLDDLLEFVKTWPGDTAVLFKRIEAYNQALNTVDNKQAADYFAKQEIDTFDAETIAKICGDVKKASVWKWIAKKRIKGYRPPRANAFRTSENNLLDFLMGNRQYDNAEVRERIKNSKACLAKARLSRLLALRSTHHLFDSTVGKPPLLGVQEQDFPETHRGMVWLVKDASLTLTAQLREGLQRLGYECKTIARERLEERTDFPANDFIGYLLPADHRNTEQRKIVGLQQREALIKRVEVTIPSIDNGP